MGVNDKPMILPCLHTRLDAFNVFNSASIPFVVLYYCILLHNKKILLSMSSTSYPGHFASCLNILPERLNSMFVEVVTRITTIYKR